MIKRNYIIAFIIIIFTLHVSAMAAREPFEVKINDSQELVHPVSLNIEGNLVASDTPSFVLVDRTLVPVRTVSEALGGQVNWNQEEKSVTIIKGKDTIKLGIDSDQVEVNGKLQTLHQRAVPRLVIYPNKDSKTMVPIRFVSETLNYDVGWDQGTKTVEVRQKEMGYNPFDVDENGEGEGQAQAVTISHKKGQGGTEYIVLSSARPMDVKTDFLGGILEVNFGQDVTLIGEAKHSGLTHMEKYPNTLRLHLNQGLPRIKCSGDKKTLSIGYPDKMAVPELVNYKGQEGLAMDYNLARGYKVQTLTNPQRVVIDLYDTYLDINQARSYEFSGGAFQGVKIENRGKSPVFKDYESTVRLTFEGRQGGLDPKVEVANEGAKLYLVPEKTLLDYVSLSESEPGARVVFKGVVDRGATGHYDRADKILFISVPTITDPNLYGVFHPNHPLIRELRVDKDNRNQVIVKFRKIVDYRITGHDGNLAVETWRKTHISPGEISIYVDAGHGGRDPGAVARDGFEEKEVNLEVANLVIDRLQGQGYHVIYTRRSDDYTDFYQVAQNANAAGADVFVSIHANAAEANSTARGVEVLYAPAEGLSHKFDRQEPLARALLEETIRTTGAKNRGLVKRPNVAVIKNTNMAAALIEVGFITNDEEREKLKDPSYRADLAEGIVNGIVRFVRTDL